MPQRKRRRSVTPGVRTSSRRAADEDTSRTVSPSDRPPAGARHAVPSKRHAARPKAGSQEEDEHQEAVATLVAMLRTDSARLGDVLRKHVGRSEDLDIPNYGFLPHRVALQALAARNEELLTQAFHGAEQPGGKGSCGSSSSPVAQASKDCKSSDLKVASSISQNLLQSLACEDPFAGEARLDTLCQDLAEAKGHAGIFGSCRADLEDRMEAAEEAHNEARGTAASLNAAVVEAQRHAQSEAARCERLEARGTNLGKEIKSLESQIKELQAELLKKQQDRSKVAAETAAAKQGIADRRREIADLQGKELAARKQEDVEGLAAAEVRQRLSAFTSLMSDLDHTLSVCREAAQLRYERHIAKVNLWTPQDVGDWLRHHENGRWAEYAEEFQDQGIRGELLPTITNEELLTLGVRQLDKRRALSHSIKELFKEASSSSSHVPTASRAQESSSASSAASESASKRLRSGPAGGAVSSNSRRLRLCHDALEDARQPPPQRSVKEQPPPELVCPILCTLVKEPVAIRGDDTGHAYELGAIRRWFAEGNLTVPLTNEPVPTPASRELLPLREHGRRAAEWRRNHPEED